MREHDDWESLLQEKNISIRYDSTYPTIACLKYLPQADFFDPIVCECRGIIVETKTKTVVGIAFDKFFNWHEPYAAPIDWTSAKCQEKLDGSLIKMYFLKGEWRWATLGTTDARDAPVAGTNKTFYDLIQMALPERFYDTVPLLDKLSTHIFELCSPWNQVVVRYDEPKLWYLSSRSTIGGEEYRNQHLEKLFDMPKELPVYNIAQVQNMLDKIDGSNAEGFVVVDRYSERVKFKSLDYIRLHHSINNGILSKEEFVRIYKENDLEAIEAIKHHPLTKEMFKWYECEMAEYLLRVEDTIRVSREAFRVFQDRGKFARNFANDIEQPFRALAFMAIDNLDKSSIELAKSLNTKAICVALHDYPL